MYPCLPRRVCIPLLLSFACATAQATRPMVVDDASIADPGTCQLESWTQHNANQSEYWALPACNVGGAWELAAGVGSIRPDGPYPTDTAGIVRAKTVFRPLEKNGWGIGLTIANQFSQGTGALGDLSAIVPASVSLFDDQLLFHANLGVLRARAGGALGAVWAAGGEWATTPAVALTLEAYDLGHAPGFSQAGARFTAIPDRLAFDAGMGERLGHHGAERYYTLGLTFAGPVRW